MKFKIFASNILLHEILHFVSGSIVGIFLYFLYGRVDLSIIAFLTGFLVDVDHYFEALFYFRFNLIAILRNKYNCWLQTKKMTIFFHSWELVLLIFLLGWIFNFMPLAVAIGVSTAIHLLVDTFVYSTTFDMPVYQYFLIYRAFNKFDFVKLYNEGKSHKMTIEEINDKYGKK